MLHSSLAIKLCDGEGDGELQDIQADIILSLIVFGTPVKYQQIMTVKYQIESKYIYDYHMKKQIVQIMQQQKYNNKTSREDFVYLPA